MSLQYSQGIETKTLQATRFIQNVSCEFHLGDVDVNYLPNMRLTGLGYKLSAVSADNKINPLGGAWNCIKNITLYDGREVLDRLSNSSMWLAFQQARRDNHKNRSVVSVLSRGDYSYQSIGDSVVLGTGGAIHNLTQTDISPTSHLDLRECLNLLASPQLTSLNSGVFKNLRLLVEFQNDPHRLTTKGNVAITILEPELVVDISRESMPMSKSIMWNAIEHDEYSLPAIANPANGTVVKSSNSNRLNGFNNKTCDRLCIIKQYQNLALQADDVKPKNGSLANFNESLNFQVNGACVLPESLNTPSMKTHIFTEAWGDLCVAPCFNEPYSASTDVIAEKQCGLTDYIGIDLGGVALKELTIQHDRSATNDDGSKPYQMLESQRCHTFVEVRKSIVMEGSDYVVSYV